MGRILFCVCILLTAACAPVVVTVPAAGGDVLPAEAQRVIDRATATAAAYATAGAQATASELAARATSTAAAQLTLGALAVEQTRAALQLTAGAGAAMSTDIAAQRTQAAAQTQAWATPTAAALRTQAAYAATQAAGEQARAASVGEFWETLRAVLIVTLVVAGLTAITVLAVDRLTAVRIARLREQAAIAREAFRLLPPGHWAEWAPGEGYQVYTLPGLLDAPAAIVEHQPTQPSRVHGWRQAVRLFGWWGSQYGFTRAELMARGVVTDPAYRRLAGVLKAAGVLGDVIVPGKPGRQTGWRPEWNFARLADELSAGRLDAHLPTGESEPAVGCAVPNLTPAANLTQPDHPITEPV
ncbi:MAG: hypothetical protein IT318_23850 [Anaerolineales bacterium]|nr:hypothetical protein [Anaerolineales bacterium]